MLLRQRVVRLLFQKKLSTQLLINNCYLWVITKTNILFFSKLADKRPEEPTTRNYDDHVCILTAKMRNATLVTGKNVGKPNTEVLVEFAVWRTADNFTNGQMLWFTCKKKMTLATANSVRGIKVFTHPQNEAYPSRIVFLRKWLHIPLIILNFMKTKLYVKNTFAEINVSLL